MNQFNDLWKDKGSKMVESNNKIEFANKS
jgi:hypothetical protein